MRLARNALDGRPDRGQHPPTHLGPCASAATPRVCRARCAGTRRIVSQRPPRRAAACDSPVPLPPHPPTPRMPARAAPSATKHTRASRATPFWTEGLCKSTSLGACRMLPVKNCTLCAVAHLPTRRPNTPAVVPWCRAHPRRPCSPPRREATRSCTTTGQYYKACYPVPLQKTPTGRVGVMVSVAPPRVRCTPTRALGTCGGANDDNE